LGEAFVPIRSNIYQRLVAQIHREAGGGFTIRESRLLRDRRTGADREVDVVMEASVGGYTVLVSVEVSERSRRADVTWVESMAQKHSDLPTGKLVLWSPSGFSAPALAKANALGIEAITPGRADEAPWAKLASDLAGGSVKFVRPRFTPFVDVILPEGRVERWNATPETILRQANGDLEAPIGLLIERINTHPEVRSVMLDHAPIGAGVFHAVYELPFDCVVDGPDGTQRAVKQLVFQIDTEAEEASVDTRTAVRGDIATTVVEAMLSDGRLDLVVRETISGKKQSAARHVQDKRKGSK
jgi:hypothetical protein